MFVMFCNQNMCQLYYKSCIVELEEDIFLEHYCEEDFWCQLLVANHE
jgi:hypothetical protein